jgi:hypothetical protein
VRGLMIGLVLGALVAGGGFGATAAMAKDQESACYVSKAESKYPGDSASATEIATWMADGAKEAGLPPELPVMAALVESGLRNLPAGDSDSAGYFQMRVSIWNMGEYLGFPSRPELQLRWFLDLAIAFKSQRIAAGLSTTDERFFGEWVADIERPAEQFRGRYQLRLEEARALIKH